MLRGYSNTIDDVKELICKIIDTPTGNDYIEMRAKGFEEISPQRKYHGISTQIIAQIKNVRVPFNVDIGVGDIIVPRAEERTINTQLPDFEAPVIKTYSLESTIAEKFDAILQRFELTGRMKDFYDIYYLSRTFDFEGAKLQAAIFETLPVGVSMILQINSFTSSIVLEYPRSKKSTSIVALLSKLVKV